MPVVVKSFDFADPLTIRHRHLPHWRQDGCAYFVTHHLCDSLPASILRLWSEVRGNWLDLHPLPWSDAEAVEYHERFTEEMERHLDAGRGSCVLRNAECARVVADTLLHGDGSEYDLGTFVVMPNHVHAMVVPRPGVDLSVLAKAWKSVSTRRINRVMGRRGSLWAEEGHDHIVRNAADLERIDAYIRRNPEKAGLREGMFLLDGSIADWRFAAPDQ